MLGANQEVWCGIQKRGGSGGNTLSVKKMERITSEIWLGRINISANQEIEWKLQKCTIW